MPPLYRAYIGYTGRFPKMYTYICTLSNCVHLYTHISAAYCFKLCTPISDTATAGNLSKMHTYIYPVLTCCKKCIPIPAPAFAGILFKLCTPIYTQTPPAFCRPPSRFERLCPDFVASIGAHFFLPFLFHILPPLRVLLYVYIL